MNFASDNNSGVCPEVMAGITEEASRFDAAYGADQRSIELSVAMAEVFDREVDVYCVPTGTAANSLSLAAVNPGWGAVLCPEHSHILVDECAAPTVIGAGLSLLPLESEHGKLTRPIVEAYLAARHDTGVHSVALTSLSVAQVTETGTRYSPDELAELADLAHSHDMALHMDGARFANAVASSGSTPSELTWRAGVDIMSFGATKGGALGAEAIVVFDPSRVRDDIERLRKRIGHLLSTQRFTAAQFVSWLGVGTWLTLADHANQMAARLADELRRSGIDLSHPVDANMIFAWLDPATTESLRAAGARFYQDNPVRRTDGTAEARLVTSWSTTTEDVDRFAAIVSGR